MLVTLPRISLARAAGTAVFVVIVAAATMVVAILAATVFLHCRLANDTSNDGILDCQDDIVHNHSWFDEFPLFGGIANYR